MDLDKVSGFLLNLNVVTKFDYRKKCLSIVCLVRNLL